MTIEVSITPRATGASATRCRVLIDEAVDVSAEPRGVDGRGVLEGGERNVGRDEATPVDRRELGDRDAVAGDQEALAFVEGAHDLAALIAQMSLCDDTSHHATVARVLRTSCANPFAAITRREVEAQVRCLQRGHPANHSTKETTLPALRRLLSPSLAVAIAALVVALGGTAIAASEITGSDAPETVLRMRVTKDGKLIGSHHDGTVKKAGVGIYDITFSTGPTGSKVPLDLEECAVFATPRVEKATPDEVDANLDVQRLGGSRIFVESTRPLPFGENKIVPFLTNVSFDVAAIC